MRKGDVAVVDARATFRWWMAPRSAVRESRSSSTTIRPRSTRCSRPRRRAPARLRRWPLLDGRRHGQPAGAARRGRSRTVSGSSWTRRIRSCAAVRRAAASWSTSASATASGSNTARSRKGSPRPAASRRRRATRSTTCVLRQPVWVYLRAAAVDRGGLCAALDVMRDEPGAGTAVGERRVLSDAAPGLGVDTGTSSTTCADHPREDRRLLYEIGHECGARPVPDAGGLSRPCRWIRSASAPASRRCTPRRTGRSAADHRGRHGARAQDARPPGRQGLCTGARLRSACHEW